MDNTAIVFERKANYYETDQMGVVHHSNYIRWFEEARIEYMNRKGYPYSKMEEMGVMIPVTEVDCKYRIPVKFAQEVLIYTGIDLFDGLRLTIAYEVRDKETDKLLVTGHSKHCFVNAETFRPIRLNKEHPEMAEIFILKDKE